MEEAGPGLREVEYLAHVHGRKMTELRIEILFYLEGLVLTLAH